MEANLLMCNFAVLIYEALPAFRRVLLGYKP